MRKIMTLGITLLFSGCYKYDPSINLERTIKSPDQKTSATIVKYNYDATVPFVYRIFIHEDSKIDYYGNGEVMTTDSIENLTLNWTDNQALNITCTTGRIYKFINFIHINGYNVEVNLDTKCSPEEKSLL